MSDGSGEVLSRRKDRCFDRVYAGTALLAPLTGGPDSLAYRLCVLLHPFRRGATGDSAGGHDSARIQRGAERRLINAY